MEIISSLKPDIWASLADEVPARVSVKRNKASVDRTLRWLDDCISLDKVCGVLDQNPDRNVKCSFGLLFVTIGRTWKFS